MSRTTSPSVHPTLGATSDFRVLPSLPHHGRYAHEYHQARSRSSTGLWGAGIIRIGKAHSEGGDYVGAAREHLKTLYGYHLGDVVFKPTLAAEAQFRNDVEGALSYFVGGNEKYAEDGGFAIKGWTAVRFENCGILCQESTAQAMGNYFFTGPDGSVTKVEYSFGYIRDDSGNLIINLHHSSLPYAG